jgi:hypothetical protein
MIPPDRWHTIASVGDSTGTAAWRRRRWLDGGGNDSTVVSVAMALWWQLDNSDGGRSNVLNVAAKTQQRLRWQLGERCDGSMMSRQGEEGRGEGGSNAVWSLCFVFCQPNFKLQSKQKSGNFPGDFQQTSRNSAASCYRTRSRYAEVPSAVLQHLPQI